MKKLKSHIDFQGMKKAGAFAYELLNFVESDLIKPGISTKEISDLVDEKTQKHGAISAPKGYKGFPEACCTSINDVVCHGIPSSKQILKSGDIINVDVTPIVDGYHGDSSRTFIVGEPKDLAKNTQTLVECTKKCLELGIAALKHKCTVQDIALPITIHAHKHNFSVVREFVGHGIGKEFHLSPNIQHCYHAAKSEPRITLKKHMCFTIEPMINQGSRHVMILSDGWTAVTQDNMPSAQFEHTIGIDEKGKIIIFTLPSDLD